MKISPKRNVLIAVLLALVGLGVGALAAQALWSDRVSKTLTLTGGISAFSVTGPVSPAQAISPAAVQQFTTPNGFFGDGSGANPFFVSGKKYLPVQIAGSHQGNNGLAYRLNEITVTSTTSDPLNETLIDELSLAIYSVANPAACVGNVTGALLYEGEITAAQIEPSLNTVIQDSTYSESSVPVVRYLCAVFSIADDASGTYENVGSVSGTWEGAGGGSVSDSSTWTVGVGPDAAGYDIALNFEFAPHNYRGTALGGG